MTDEERLEQTRYRAAGATYEWVLDERSGMYWQRPTGIGVPRATEKLCDPAANAEAALRYVRARYGQDHGWGAWAAYSYAYPPQRRFASVRELLEFGWLFLRHHGRDVVRRWWHR